MALLVKITQPGAEDRFKVIAEDERAIELLDAGLRLWIVEEVDEVITFVEHRVDESSRVTESTVVTLSATTEVKV